MLLQYFRDISCFLVMNAAWKCLFVQLFWLLHLQRNGPSVKQFLKLMTPELSKWPSRSIQCAYIIAQKTHVSFLLLLMFYWQIYSQTYIGAFLVFLSFPGLTDCLCILFALSAFSLAMLFDDSQFSINNRSRRRDVGVNMDENGWVLCSSMSWI